MAYNTNLLQINKNEIKSLDTEKGMFTENTCFAFAKIVIIITTRGKENSPNHKGDGTDGKSYRIKHNFLSR